MCAARELRHLSLGDDRLNRRLCQIVDALAARSEASVPQAAGTWAATKATYRFWDNDRVDPEAILAAHRQSTLGRLPASGMVLAIQDTVTLNFTDHPATTGLGYLGRSQQTGVLMHSVLLARDDGTPLGLVHHQVWVRDPEKLGKRASRRHKETAEKESQRWLDGLARAEASVPAAVSVLTIADREADFYDLLAAPRRVGSHLLIRAKPRRRVRQPQRLLGAAVRASRPRGTMAVSVPRSDDRPAREAVLTIRYRTLTIRPPATHPRRRELPDLTVTAVLAAERDPPEGVQPIRWFLLTTLPLTGLEDATRAVRHYSRRWVIERYHYVLKSGCRVERLQLQAVERLRRALATYCIVAWQLLWLTYEARNAPDASCESVLSEEHWPVLHRAVFPKKPLPTTPPSLRDAVRMIARLGGFLARKCDGEPGVKAIWRGLRRFEDLYTGWKLATSRPPPVVGNA